MSQEGRSYEQRKKGVKSQFAGTKHCYQYKIERAQLIQAFQYKRSSGAHPGCCADHGKAACLASANACSPRSSDCKQTPVDVSTRMLTTPRRPTRLMLPCSSSCK